MWQNFIGLFIYSFTSFQQKISEHSYDKNSHFQLKTYNLKRVQTIFTHYTYCLRRSCLHSRQCSRTAWNYQHKPVDRTGTDRLHNLSVAWATRS